MFRVSMLYLFYLQVLYKVDLEVLYFYVYLVFAILEWFLIWHFKHSRIPVRKYSQRNIYHLYHIIIMPYLPVNLIKILVLNLGNNP